MSAVVALPSVRRRSGQASAPLVDAVRQYAARGTWAFHVPGHKRGGGADADLRTLVGDAVLSHDVWLETGAYDAARRGAEELAASAFGATRASLLGNGSTSGNQAFLLSTVAEGDEVVVSRDLHTSTLTGLILTGAKPIWVAPRLHPVLDIGLGVRSCDVAAALAAHPSARLVSVVSPSYAGVCSDLTGISAAAHGAGALSYVDAAWGAHHGFHAALPRSAMASGADAAVVSVHKTLPALSSGSLLLSGPAVDADRLDSCVRMTQTTSPFLPLLASVDLARRTLALDGAALIDRALSLATEVRRRLRAIPGLRVLDAADLGIPESLLDPLKVVVDVAALGLTGLAAESLLRSRYGIAPEGADLTSIYLVLALGDSSASVEALTEGMRALASAAPRPRLPRPRAERPLRRSSGAVLAPAPAVLTPRRAHQSRQRSIPLADAVGEVCAELVTPYPPGVPVLVPGEAVTAEAVAYLREAVARGVHLHGCADPTLAGLRVVAW